MSKILSFTKQNTFLNSAHTKMEHEMMKGMSKYY